jgi:predicted RND superfamily exporter protein
LIFDRLKPAVNLLPEEYPLLDWPSRQLYPDKRHGLRFALGHVVIFCIERPWIIIATALLLTIASCTYVVRNFTIETDVNKLVSADVLWRKQELAFSQSFPQQLGTIFVVVEAPSVELVGQATTALTHELSRRQDLFQSVDEPGIQPVLCSQRFVIRAD